MPATEPFTDPPDRASTDPADRHGSADVATLSHPTQPARHVPVPTHPTEPARHVPVDAVTRRIANPLLRILARCGWGVRGVRILTVVGRRSGRQRDGVVIPVEVDGVEHLVAPRGHTDWVRNLRAAGRGELRLGRRRTPFLATELRGEPSRTRPEVRSETETEAGTQVPTTTMVESGPQVPTTTKAEIETANEAGTQVPSNTMAENENAAETQTEAAVRDRVRVLRAYLRDNRALVASILGDLDADSPEVDLAQAVRGIPIFRLDPIGADGIVHRR